VDQRARSHDADRGGATVNATGRCLKVLDTLRRTNATDPQAQEPMHSLALLYDPTFKRSRGFLGFYRHWLTAPAASMSTLAILEITGRSSAWRPYVYYYR